MKLRESEMGRLYAHTLWKVVARHGDSVPVRMDSLMRCAYHTLSHPELFRATKIILAHVWSELREDNEEDHVDVSMEFIDEWLSRKSEVSK